MRAIVIKELRSYLRGARPFTLITVYLTILGGLLLLMYSTTVNDSFVDRSEIGLTLYITVVGLSLAQIAFLTPSMNAGALGGERDRQTLDLLMVTPLGPLRLIIGKLIAPCLFLLLMSVATLPLAGFAFLIGGIEARDLLVALVLMLITTISYGTIGIWASAVARTSRSGTLLAQGIVFMLAIGLPVLAVLLINLFDGSDARDLMSSPLFVYPGAVLMALSPFVGLISWVGVIESGGSPWVHEMGFPFDVTVPVFWLTSLVVWSILVPILIWRSAKALPRTVARQSGG